MKKIVLMLLSLLVVTGCAAKAKTGVAESAKDGEAYVRVEVTVEGDKITSVNIDEFGATSLDGSKSGSKKSLGDDYSMKTYSPIQREWYEQIKSLEDFIVANGVDAVETDEAGKVVNADLKAECTISVANYLTYVKEAQNNAK